MQFNYKINYFENGLEKSIDNLSNMLDISVSTLENGCTLIEGTLKNDSLIELKYAEMFFKCEFNKGEKIMSNGYQSWTKSREYDIFEKERKNSKLVKLADSKLHLSRYGDYNFYKYKNKEGVIHSHAYTYIRNDKNYRFFGALTDKLGYHIFETDVKNSILRVIVDIEGLVLSGDRKIFSFIIVEGTQTEVFDKYFESRNIPKCKAKKIKGFTSWYNYYQNINEEIILKNIANFEKFNKDGNHVDIFQIDDGFQTAVGDWLSIDKTKFPNGIKPIAKKIKENFMAGLWLAPFCCEKTSEIYKNHKDWILKDKKGNLVYAGMNWSGFFALDIYNKEVVEYLKKVFDTVFNDWGFDLVKLDFLYSACLGDYKDKTRGEVMTYGMELIRDLCKDKLVLGCGVPLSPSFGLVDYCRIGCDVSLDFTGGWQNALLNNECVSTSWTMLSSVVRYPLNKRAFLNDTDVFLLRDDNIKMNDEEKFALSLTNALFGEVFFTSDDFSLYPNKYVYDRLVSVWKLNDCELIEYGFCTNFMYYAKVLVNDKVKTIYVNVSSKKVEYNGITVEAKSSLIIK